MLVPDVSRRPPVVLGDLFLLTQTGHPNDMLETVPQVVKLNPQKHA